MSAIETAETAYLDAQKALDRQGNAVGSSAMFCHGAYSDAVSAMRTVRALNGDPHFLKKAIDALVGYESHLDRWRAEVIRTAATALDFTEAAREVLIAQGAKRCAAIDLSDDNRGCGRLYIGDGSLCPFHEGLDAEQRERDAQERESDDRTARAAFYGSGL